MLSEQEKIIVISALNGAACENRQQQKIAEQYANDEIATDKDHWEKSAKFWSERAETIDRAALKIMRMKCSK